MRCYSIDTPKSRYNLILPNVRLTVVSVILGCSPVRSTPKSIRSDRYGGLIVNLDVGADVRDDCGRKSDSLPCLLFVATSSNCSIGFRAGASVICVGDVSVLFFFLRLRCFRDVGVSVSCSSICTVALIEIKKVIEKANTDWCAKIGRLFRCPRAGFLKVLKSKYLLRIRNNTQSNDNKWSLDVPTHSCSV